MWGRQTQRKRRRDPPRVPSIWSQKIPQIEPRLESREKNAQVPTRKEDINQIISPTAQQVSFMPPLITHVFAIFKSPATPKPVWNWFRCQGLESHTSSTLCLCVCHCSRWAQCLLYHFRVAFECHDCMVTHVSLPVGREHVISPAEGNYELKASRDLLGSVLRWHAVKKSTSLKKIADERRYKSIYESHPLCNPGEVGAHCACFERQWHAVTHTHKVLATTILLGDNPGERPDLRRNRSSFYQFYFSLNRRSRNPGRFLWQQS